jgi:virginiamycin B lyase
MSVSGHRVVEHVIASDSEGPYSVAVTSDGAVWCTLIHAGVVVRLEPSAVPAGDPLSVTRIPLGDGSQPAQLAVADETSVWVTDTTGNRVVLLGPVAPADPAPLPRGARPAPPAAFGIRLAVEVPTAGAQPFGITTSYDGTVWFTEMGRDSLGRIDILGRVTEFPAGTDGGFVSMIASSGESLWFTVNQANAIGYIRGGDSAVQLFDVPTPHSGPVGITVGDDGAAWFAEIVAGKIGRVDRDGRFTEHPLPWSESKPHAICPDPAGGCWFTLWGSNQLGHIDPDGALELIDLSDTQSEPHGLAVAPDGTVWVAMESGALCAYAPPAGQTRPAEG